MNYPIVELLFHQVMPPRISWFAEYVIYCKNPLYS
jgi:hypothetical protein